MKRIGALSWERDPKTNLKPADREMYSHLRDPSDYLRVRLDVYAATCYGGRWPTTEEEGSFALEEKEDHVYIGVACLS